MIVNHPSVKLSRSNDLQRLFQILRTIVAHLAMQKQKCIFTMYAAINCWTCATLQMTCTMCAACSKHGGLVQAEDSTGASTSAHTV